MNKVCLSLVLIINLLSSLTYAGQDTHRCNIKAFDKVYVIKSKAHSVAVDEVIKDSNCPSSIQQKFTQVLMKFNGAVRGVYLNTAFKTTFAPYNIKVIPSSIKIISLSEFVKSRLNLGPLKVIKNLKMISKKRTIATSNEVQLSVDCSSCKNLGEKNAKITLVDVISNRTLSQWISFDLLVKTKALVSTRSIGVTNQPLSRDIVKIKPIETSTPEKLFLDVDKLQYYKLNKPLQTGQPIEAASLVPINLVTFGKLAKVMYQNGLMKLKTKAMPAKSAKYGETIQLSIPANRNIILGTVIGPNQVRVEQ
ncbi:MAG: flagellar basal body P-ring formation protein FlgA [Bacteriovoracaceae bacterium]|nr:flagellar basal body P-ring formation protein FlgA [Bacteriovoracaceae bacterium]